jgi:hypothetical protein
MACGCQAGVEPVILTTMQNQSDPQCYRTPHFDQARNRRPREVVLRRPAGRRRHAPTGSEDDLRRAAPIRGQAAAHRPGGLHLLRIERSEIDCLKGSPKGRRGGACQSGAFGFYLHRKLTDFWGQIFGVRLHPHRFLGSGFIRMDQLPTGTIRAHRAWHYTKKCREDQPAEALSLGHRTLSLI